MTTVTLALSTRLSSSPLHAALTLSKEHLCFFYSVSSLTPFKAKLPEVWPTCMARAFVCECPLNAPKCFPEESRKFSTDFVRDTSGPLTKRILTKRLTL